MFEANVSQIGLLPADLAGEVAGFYSHARGIVRDFLTINKGEPILILRDPYDVGWMAKRLLTSRTEPYLGARVAHIEAKSVV
jgi:glycine cleavage system H lipoate-binding protein